MGVTAHLWISQRTLKKKASCQYIVHFVNYILAHYNLQDSVPVHVPSVVPPRLLEFSRQVPQYAFYPPPFPPLVFESDHSTESEQKKTNLLSNIINFYYLLED